MFRHALLTLIFLANTAGAQDRDALIRGVVREHILPGFEQFEKAGSALRDAAERDCQSNSKELLDAYHSAFDAWLGVSHLRFGPTEVENRAFALAFWPDTRGATPKALTRLISAQDPVVEDGEIFTTVSVAARGLYALEYLVFDQNLSTLGDADYRCSLIRAIARDIHGNASRIRQDWQTDFISVVQNAPAGPYQTKDEVIKEFFKALSTGLEFTSDTRLGRPLGTFDKPRPNRAEARRSDRSKRNVLKNLSALADLGRYLSEGFPTVQDELDIMFERAILVGERLDDPAFAGVKTVQGRIRVEAFQQAIQRIREVARIKLGPALGVSAGFNSLDGD